MHPSPQNAESIYQVETSKQRRDDLIVEHLGFVRTVLGRTVFDLPSNLDYENLEAAGVLGLVEAAQQFDPTRKVLFRTFAYQRIRGAILDELRRNCPLPQRMLKIVTQIRSACDELESPVTPEQISAHTGLSSEEVESGLAAMRLRKIELWDNSENWTSDFCDLKMAPPEQQVEQKDTIAAITKALTQLPEKERLVVTLYYMEGLRLREIGEVLELSESRISRLLSKAEFRLGQLVNREAH
jgi:RNA polymerase sigma factor for flagellar operon FliA